MSSSPCVRPTGLCGRWALDGGRRNIVLNLTIISFHFRNYFITIVAKYTYIKFTIITIFKCTAQ